MAPCAIALQELINVCYKYSNEIDFNFNATKSFCAALLQNIISFRCHHCL